MNGIEVRAQRGDAGSAARASADHDWDAFVAQRAEARLGHASVWRRVFADAYGVETLHLEARDRDGRLRGVLPVASVRTLSFGKSLVSLPFLDAAGVLSEDAEAEVALLESVCAHGADVELRQSEPLRSRPIAAASRVELFLPVGRGEEASWRALPGKVRNQTRKAWRERLFVEPSPRDAVDFHRIHCDAMRELGSPPHAYAFFRAVLDAFGERARCIVARDGTRAGAPAVGGLVAIEHAGVVHVPWASTLAGERARCPNNLLYWEALRWAEARGAREFSFGRSPWNGGTYRFKRGWGAAERPLHWTRLDSRGGAAPAHPAADSRPLQLLARVWKQLPPALCNRVGPLLRQRIPS